MQRHPVDNVVNFVLIFNLKQYDTMGYFFPFDIGIGVIWSTDNYP